MPVTPMHKTERSPLTVVPAHIIAWQRNSYGGIFQDAFLLLFSYNVGLKMRRYRISFLAHLRLTLEAKFMYFCIVMYG